MTELIALVGTMRDLRQELTERLRELEAQRDGFHTELKRVEDEIGVVLKMLDFEDRRFPKQQPKEIHRPTDPLGDFIYREIERRRMNKNEIKITAERAGYENVGRAVHLTLVNLERFGRIRVGSDGKYEILAAARNDQQLPPSFSFSDRTAAH